MERPGRIDWAQLLFGTVAWDVEWPALDDARFERIADGFAAHYVVTPTGSDSFDFARGEGFDRFGRLDAFAYVDSGRVRRVRAEPVALPAVAGAAGSITAFPAGWRAIAFQLNIRVLLIFWAFALVAAKLVLAPWSSWAWWMLGSGFLYAVYVRLVLRSLRAKLAAWMKRDSWN